MLFDQFDRIRIINLAHRKDRRREMEAQLAKVGLLGDPRVAFFQACVEPDRGRFYSRGAKGAFNSHMHLIHEAASEGGSLLILEDDCDFVSPEAFNLPETWDVFYGGYDLTSDADPHKSDIVGAHCMGFSERALNRLQPWLRLGAWNGDDPAPIDGEYVRFRRANPDMVTVFADPQIARQRASRTDIGAKRWFDQIPVVRGVAEKARRMRAA